MINTRFNKKYVFYILAGAVSTFLISIALLQVFFALLTFMWFAEKLSEKKKDFNFIFFSVIAFLVVRLAATALSVNPAKSAEIFYKEILFYTGFLSLSFYIKTLSSDELRKLLFYSVISAASVAVIGIVRFATKSVMRAESFSSGYTVFSSYLLAFLAIAIFLKYDDKYKGIITGLITTGIICSLGRTNIAIAGLLIAAGVLSKNIPLKQLAILILITVSISFTSFQINTSEIKGRIEKPAALSDRDIIYKGAEQLLFERPIIGFGPRTFSEVFPLRDEFTDKGVGGWHNDFMQIYFESGIIGLITFLVLLAAPIAVFIKRLKLTTNKDILYAGCLSILAMILSAITAGFITNAVLSLVFAFLLGIQSYFILEGNNNGK